MIYILNGQLSRATEPPLQLGGKPWLLISKLFQMDFSKNVDVDHPECIALATFSSFQEDFATCAALCDHFCEYWENLKASNSLPAPHRLPIIDGLAIAIPVSYVRPFASGSRGKLKLPPAYDESEIALHNTVLHMRNMHVAHSVNSMEETVTRIFLRDTSHSLGKGISGVGTSVSVVGSLSVELYRQLAGMCHKARAWLRNARNLETERLIKVFEKCYSIEDLYAQESQPEQNEPYDLSKVAKSRPSMDLSDSWPEYVETPRKKSVRNNR